jgi:hypothetical protein
MLNQAMAAAPAHKTTTIETVSHTASLRDNLEGGCTDFAASAHHEEAAPTSLGRPPPQQRPLAEEERAAKRSRVISSSNAMHHAQPGRHDSNCRPGDEAFLQPTALQVCNGEQVEHGQGARANG